MYVFLPKLIFSIDMAHGHGHEHGPSKMELPDYEQLVFGRNSTVDGEILHPMEQNLKPLCGITIKHLMVISLCCYSSIFPMIKYVLRTVTTVKRP